MVAGGVSIASVIGDYGGVVCYYRWGCVADVVLGLLFVMILVRMLMCCDGLLVVVVLLLLVVCEPVQHQGFHSVRKQP